MTTTPVANIHDAPYQTPAVAGFASGQQPIKPAESNISPASPTSPTLPNIVSLDDLTSLCQHYTDSDGILKFSFSSFTFVSADYMVYYGEAPMYKLSIEAVRQSLERVPDEDVYPMAQSHKTTTTLGESYFKRPRLKTYDVFKGTGLVAELLLREAETLELLQRNPHPNLIQYHGCKVCRGRIVGLVLKRYRGTLEEYMKGGNDLSLAGFDGIKLAVHHLHSLGYAHNDIKADNIMIDADNAWILVDMDSCRPFGAKLIMAGDREWIASSPENDKIALDKLWSEVSRHQSEHVPTSDLKYMP